MNRTRRAFLLVPTTLCLVALSATVGQFKRAAYYHAGQRPYKVLTAPLTSSGNLDLAVADWLSNQLCILLGNGSGTFQKQQCISVPAPGALATGDFDEDGNQDLAVMETGGTGKGTLCLYLGKGDGTFRKGACYQLGVETVSVAVSDFNNDGHLDVAVANSNQSGKAGNVMVFFGDGQGKLGNPETYKVTGAPWSIATADLNGDHHPDLAVTQFAGGSVAILLNDGTGHFQKPVTYSAGDCCGPVDVKIADLRNNGKQDLVIANINAGMVVLLNKGDGTFGKPTIYTPFFQNWQPPEACTVADFNLDGKLDVACVAQLNDAYLFYGEGNGKFGSGIEIKESLNHDGGFSIAAGDFNNDKSPDLAIPIQDHGKVAILLNTK
jgi:hypothetical protein